MSDNFMTEEFAQTLTQIVSQSVVSALAERDKQAEIAQKATVGNTGSFNLIHGHGSLFGQVAVGIEPDVISARMGWRGLGDVLPKIASPYLEVFLPFITGVEETSSTEQTTECGNCISGETEACIQQMPTGRVCRETKEMTITRIVDRLNRGDIDLTLLNQQLGSNSAWHPGTAMTQNNLMQIATAWALMYELPPLFANKLSPMVYTGNPTNNVGQAYREFRGLQQLVNTGFLDAFVGVACSALDSDLKDFGHQNLATHQDPSFYELLEMAHYYVQHNADGQALAPVTHVVVMRSPLWQVLSQLIPQQRAVNTMMAWAAASGQTVNFNGTELADERDRFRQTKVIPLNGEMVPVIVDDGIPELNNANNANYNPGEYGSDVYVLPLTYLGNRQALQIQYKDYRAIGAEIAGTNGMIDGYYRSTPDGRFAWAVVTNGACFKIQAFTEPRIVLKTPQLAARIQNVKYVPIQHTREPSPDSPYFHKDGISVRPPHTPYYFR
jgi:hypothetical protein